MDNNIKKLAGNFEFLQGGGESGELTRQFNWLQTPLGTPDQWPQSLRSTVSIVLHSAFPMFLFWGEELTCFYNDAFRPSLGADGKHPSIGKKGKDVWAEIWDFIGPLIEQVMTTGVPVWFEDQLVPFYRNGRIEDIYWTFSYSPAYRDDGKIAGVFVTCTETTEKVNNLKELAKNKEDLQMAVEAAKKNEQNLRNIFAQAPVAVTLFRGPKFIVEIANVHTLKIWGKTAEEAIGKPIFDVLPEAKGKGFEELLSRVYTTGENYSAYGVAMPFMSRRQPDIKYISFTYAAYRDSNGVVAGVMATSTDVTNEILARQRTEENEERFRTMAENTDILIAEADEESNATYFNSAWLNLTGRPIEDLLKLGWADLIHPDDRDGFVNTYLTAFNNKEPFEGEFRILNKDGGYCWLLAKGAVRSNPDGSFAGHISSSVDITGRKRGEEASRKSEQRVRSLVEGAPFPIGVYIGREMRVTFANEAILNIWGKGHDVIGKLFSEVLPELDNQEVFTQLDNVFSTGIPFHIRNQHLDLEVNGKTQPYYFNYSLTPLFDETGKVYGIMNTGADVTDLNIAKKKVEENERSFRNTISKAPVAMCIFRGPNHIVEIANDRMIEFWGRPASDVLNKPIFEGLPEASDQGFEQLLDNVFTTGETFAAQDIPITLPRDGKIKTVYVNFLYEAYREENGTISGVIAVAIDVTDQVFARRKIEEVVTERTKELAAANADLQRSNAELAQFAYIASHDLQEPVRKISTFAQMLTHSLGAADDTSKKYLDKITGSATRMLALIRDVLTYSELSREKEVFHQVNLRKVVENLMADFELLIEQKGAQIILAELPEIEAIPIQMSQLFGNLLSNSLKFSRQDIQPVIKITVAPLPTEEYALHHLADNNVTYYNIQFTDNGIGLKKENADRIFNIFQRLHGKSEYAGTGIGLAMCKKIAQNHNGEISAAASTENGAVFNIILPEKQPGRKDY